MRPAVTLPRLLVLILCLAAAPLNAQSADSYTINLRQTDISLLTEQIVEITGRTLIVR